MGAAIGREDFQKEQYVYREVFSFADAQAAARASASFLADSRV